MEQLQSFLNRQYGPLKTWHWLGIAILVYWMVIKR